MSSNQTTNYQLSQWVKSDQVKMEDFNADNAKIDAALGTLASQVSGKAEQSALSAEITVRTALAAQVAQCGDCMLYMTGYTGSGSYGSQNHVILSFPKQPYAVLICGKDSSMFMLRGASGTAIPYGNGAVGATVTWSGSSVQWTASVTNAASMMNASGTYYRVLALLKAGE